MLDAGATLATLAATAVATAGLAHAARRAGWIDRREGQEERKPRRSPVPLVGGAALVIGLLVHAIASGAGGGLPWLAIAGALALGLADDLLPGGLDARRKLLGQCAVGVLLALAPGAAGVEGFAERAALAVLAVVAMNAVNTFDNADGAAGVLGLLALWPVAGARAALLGFLPFNLFLRRRGVEGERPPVAMLGDSGSHVLGVLIAATPGAEPFLLVPLLDLGRLAVQRRKVGRQPWQGDRRHLAHRLELLGFGPVAVAACLAWVLSPPWLVNLVTPGNPLMLAAMLASAGLWFAALSFTPDPDRLALEPASPDSGRPSRP